MNELETRGTSDIAAEAPLDFLGGATGLEGVDRECFILPFLKIAQAGSDYAKRGSAEYLEGIQQGDFCCPMQGRIYGEEVELVILKFYRSFSVYDGESVDAKFIGTVDAATFERDIEPHAERVRSFWMDRKGHRYVDTRNFIVIPYRYMEDGPMLLSLSSTGIAPSRKILTLADNARAQVNGQPVKAPLWASVWKLKAGYFDNPQGGYYQIAGVERLGWVRKELAAGLKGMFDDLQAADMSQIRSADQARDEEPAERSQAAQAVAGAFGPKAPLARNETQKGPPATDPVTAAGQDSDLY